jgi:UPF0716 family protein affecting phage T7 exclusion
MHEGMGTILCGLLLLAVGFFGQLLEAAQLLPPPAPAQAQAQGCLRLVWVARSGGLHEPQEPAQRRTGQRGMRRAGEVQREAKANSR